MVRGPRGVWEGPGAGVGLGLGECLGEGRLVGYSGAGRVTPLQQRAWLGGREMLVPGLAPGKRIPGSPQVFPKGTWLKGWSPASALHCKCVHW